MAMRFFFYVLIIWWNVGAKNIDNIPLVIIGAMCGNKNNPFGDCYSCNNDVVYIFLK
jgi:hypothetical protein